MDSGATRFAHSFQMPETRRKNYCCRAVRAEVGYSEEATGMGSVPNRFTWITRVLLLACYWLAANARADILYVSNGRNGTIERFSTSGGGSTFAYSGLQDAEGLAFDRAGNLFVANPGIGGSGTIEKFTPDGVRSTFYQYGYGYPRGLAFDRAGKLYAGESYDSRIFKFSPEGYADFFYVTWSLFDDVRSTSGMAFDA